MAVATAVSPSATSRPSGPSGSTWSRRSAPTPHPLMMVRRSLPPPHIMVVVVVVAAAAVVVVVMVMMRILVWPGYIRRISSLPPSLLFPQSISPFLSPSLHCSLHPFLPAPYSPSLPSPSESDSDQIY
jgi:hypothetical protein